MEKNSGAIRGEAEKKARKAREEEEGKRVHSRGKCLFRCSTNSSLPIAFVVDNTDAWTVSHEHEYKWRRECESIRDTASRGSPPSALQFAACKHGSMTFRVDS